MRSRFRAVSFAAVAVTLRAFVRVDLPGSIQIGFRGSQGIFQAPVFPGDDPGSVFLDNPVGNNCESENEDCGEKKLA